jgi:hypothetical protein
MIVALISAYLILSVTACSTIEPRVVTKVEYITKGVPQALVEPCSPPTVTVVTYRDALLLLSKHQSVLKMCNTKLEGIKDFYRD